MSSVNAPVNVSTSIAGYHPLIIFRYRPLLGNELPLQASVVLRYSSCSLDLEAWTKFELTLRVKVSFCEITARFPAEKLVIVKTPGFCNTGWIFHFGHIWMLCYARFSWITWTDHIPNLRGLCHSCTTLGLLRWLRFPAWHWLRGVQLSLQRWWHSNHLWGSSSSYRA